MREDINLNAKPNKSGIWIYILLIVAIGVVAYISVKGATAAAKEKKYETKIETILDAAEYYGKTIEDRLSSKCYEIRVRDLIDRFLIYPDRDGMVLDPRTNESMNGKKICITYENDKVITYEKTN